MAAFHIIALINIYRHGKNNSKIIILDNFSGILNNEVFLYNNND
jgi:hypothetical protein